MFPSDPFIVCLNRININLKLFLAYEFSTTDLFSYYVFKIYFFSPSIYKNEFKRLQGNLILLL